jgi:hypothetical protein
MNQVLEQPEELELEFEECEVLKKVKEENIKVGTVKELLSKSDKWCKGVLALDDAGFDVDPQCSKATKFCLLGAIEHCYGSFKYGKGGRAADKLRDAIAQHIETYDKFLESEVIVPHFNDYMTTTHKDIVAVVELANI